MAKIKKSSSLQKKSELFGGIVIAVVGIGIIMTVLAAQQSTENRQHASSFQDINTADEITQTNNPDGTMGPANYTENFSNTLPNTYLGSIDLQITDPTQAPRPLEKGNNGNHAKPTDTPDNKPTNISPPTHLLPSQTGDSENDSTQANKPSENPLGPNSSGGPQTVKALNLIVTKAEVHLAHLGLPGMRNEIDTPTPEASAPGQARLRHQLTNQNVDKWETLQIDAPRTFDLVDLATNKTTPSLGLTQLANGRYTEIRLYLSSASATLPDGTKVALTMLGKENIVRIVQPFVINTNKKTTLTMDFDAQNSVIKAGNKYILKPVVAHLLSTYEK